MRESALSRCTLLPPQTQRVAGASSSEECAHQACVGVELVRRAATRREHRAPGHAQDAAEAPLRLHEVCFLGPVRDMYPHIVSVSSIMVPCEKLQLHRA